MSGNGRHEIKVVKYDALASVVVDAEGNKSLERVERVVGV